MSNRRERILIGVIATLLAVYALRSLGNRLVLEPMRLQRLQSEHLQRDIRLKQKQLETVQRAKVQLEDWRTCSLPPDVATAQTLYEGYLFELVQQHNVADWVVEPGTVFDDDSLTRFPFRVTGRITLENLTKLLHEIYQSRLLHRIRRLDLQRVNDSDQNIRMVLAIDGLSVRGAEARANLLPETLAKGGPLDGIALQDFQVISEKDILAPYRAPPPPKPTPQLAVDDVSSIHLTGTPFWGRKRQAWLHNRRTDASWILEDGQEFELAGIEGQLVAIEDAHIELQIDGQRWRLLLNRNLRQLTKAD